MFADLVDRADIRMVESGSRSCLAAKTFKGLRVLRHVIREKFERNEPPKLDVLSFVDHAHTTAPDLFEDAIVRYGLTDHGDSKRLLRQSHLSHQLSKAWVGMQRVE